MFDWISVLAPIICSLISGVLAYFAACHTSKRDLQKLQLEWDLQSITHDDQEFAEMCRLVYALAHSNISTNTDAIAAVAVVRSKASGAYAESLDALLSVVSSTQRIRIFSAVERVIAERSRLTTAKKK